MNISSPFHYAAHMKKSAALSPYVTLPKENADLFNRLTGCLGADKKDELDRTLKGQPPSKDYDLSLQTMMGRPLAELQSRNVLLGIQSYPYYALQAALKGAIREDDFYTLMLYYGAKQTLPSISGHDTVQSIPLFSGDHPSNQATALLEDSFKVVGNEKGTSFISPAEMNDFLKLMKGKSPFQQQFFLIPDYPYVVGGNKLITSTEKNEQEFGFNVFGRVTVDDKPMRIVPSFGMMQAILEARFDKDAVDLDPIFSAANFSTDQNKLTFLAGKHPFSIPFPSCPLPERVAGALSYGIDFVMVQFFLAFLTSSIPEKDRKQSLAFLEMVDIYSKSFPGHVREIESFCERLTHRMIAVYLEHVPAHKKETALFWKALDSITMDDLQEEQARKDMLRSIFKELMRNGQFYNSHYKLDIRVIFQNNRFDSLKETVEFAREDLFKDVHDADLTLIQKYSDEDPLLRFLADATLSKRLAEMELTQSGRTSL